MMRRCEEPRSSDDRAASRSEAEWKQSPAKLGDLHPRNYVNVLYVGRSRLSFCLHGLQFADNVIRPIDIQFKPCHT